MRVCGPQRASGKGFLRVEHFVPEETISFVNSLVKTQSAADGRLFSFAGKGYGMKKTLQFRRERPFVMVDYAVVMSGQLSVYELAVYLVLCAYADSREGTCFPSYQTIAGKAGCSRRNTSNSCRYSCPISDVTPTSSGEGANFHSHLKSKGSC